MKKLIIILALIAITASACSPKNPTVLPVTPQKIVEIMATATLQPPTVTASPVPPSETPEPTMTTTPSVTLFPEVTFSEKAICRLGPDEHYYRVVTFEAGQTTSAQSRSEDGKWLVVLTQTPNKSFTCWVPVLSVKDFGDVNNLLVSAVAPLPVGATNAFTNKGVCGINKRGAIVVQWGPAISGTGYYVYRNGKNIAAVYDVIYIDHDTPGSKTPYVYTYTIQAFNSAGISKVTASASVTMCD